MAFLTLERQKGKCSRFSIQLWQQLQMETDLLNLLTHEHLLLELNRSSSGHLWYHVKMIWNTRDDTQCFASVCVIPVLTNFWSLALMQDWLPGDAEHASWLSFQICRLQERDLTWMSWGTWKWLIASLPFPILVEKCILFPVRCGLFFLILGRKRCATSQASLIGSLLTPGPVSE